MSRPAHPGSIRERLTRVRRALLNFALPDSCLHCHTPLFGGEPCLCPACRRSLSLEPGLLRLAPSAALYATPYAGAAATLIRAIKFGDRPDAAVLLGCLVSSLLESLLTRSERDRVLVVPLPLHRTRRRERGYDQTRLLAEAVAACGSYPVAHGVLRRVRATRPQTLLARRERMANVSGVFRVAEPPAAGRLLILLDDVVTTGATLAAARAALELAGVPVHLAVAAAGPRPHEDGSQTLDGRNSLLLGRFQRESS